MNRKQSGQVGCVAICGPDNGAGAMDLPAASADGFLGEVPGDEDDCRRSRTILSL